jgi:hypothetical protein
VFGFSRHARLLSLSIPWRKSSKSWVQCAGREAGGGRAIYWCGPASTWNELKSTSVPSSPSNSLRRAFARAYGTSKTEPDVSRMRNLVSVS